MKTNSKPHTSHGSEQRAHPHEKKLRQLRRSIFITVAILLLTAVLLLVLPMFRVKSFVVEGNSLYSDEDIVRATGMERGDEILALLFDGIDYAHFYGACPYVQTVTLAYKMSKVVVTVTEAQNVMYTQLPAGEWFTFDSDFRVYEKMSDSAAFSEAGFLYVKLPAVSSAEVGETVVFENASLSYDYVGMLVGKMQEYQILSGIDYIDFSNRLSVSCVFANRIRLEMGTVSELDAKLDRFYDLLREIGEVEYAVINVSNPQKATYHSRVSAEELYQ